MDPAHWRAIASIESSLNPNSNQNAATQYKGLFQIGRGEWAQHGQGDIYNPLDNAMAAARIANANNSLFRAHFGREPTPIETYMMHQQGPGFYTHGTMTNIAGNTPRGMPIANSPQAFEAMWGKKLEDRASGFGGSAGNYPASVASARAMGGGGGGGGVSAGASTSAEGQQPESAPGSDLASGLAAVQDRIAKQEEADQPAPLQPMNFQPMMTPAMMRARMVAQAMLNRDLGITPPPQTPESTS
jgi:hypothetical protein